MPAVPKERPIRDDNFRQWIREQPCLLADREPCECGKYVHVGSNRMVVEACHIRVRLHGDIKNLWPGCSTHHKEQHRIGVKSFAARYGLDWKEIGERYWVRYCEEVGYVDAAS